MNIRYNVLAGTFQCQAFLYKSHVYIILLLSERPIYNTCVILFIASISIQWIFIIARAVESGVVEMEGILGGVGVGKNILTPTSV
jgi:hypothetical protein